MNRTPIKESFDPRNPFPFKLRQARMAKGLSLSDVAHRLEISKVYLSDIERGKRPPMSDGAIRVLAPMLGIPARVLIADAAISRGAFELEVFYEISEAQLRLGSMLLDQWDRLDPSEIKALLNILERSGPWPEPPIEAEAPLEAAGSTVSAAHPK